ncbi:hypothetical protein TRIUR3_10188 [Triticum urartu]|uniref:Uncharacterized protein n=1 Tax=Triticum urartu TaxID=4572 RepID=M8AIH6_TRIUA|nr:hypothetical protein TRIUR3_10188 [Triticum urartu]
MACLLLLALAWAASAAAWDKPVVWTTGTVGPEAEGCDKKKHGKGAGVGVGGGMGGGVGAGGGAGGHVGAGGVQPCKRRPLRLWEFNPEGPRAIQSFLGLTHEEMYKSFFGPQIECPNTTEDVGLSSNHAAEQGML